MLRSAVHSSKDVQALRQKESAVKGFTKVIGKINFMIITIDPANEKRYNAGHEKS
jgi:hypothetical protein